MTMMMIVMMTQSHACDNITVNQSWTLIGPIHGLNWIGSRFQDTVDWIGFSRMTVTPRYFLIGQLTSLLIG